MCNKFVAEVAHTGDSRDVISLESRPIKIMGASYVRNIKRIEGCAYSKSKESITVKLWAMQNNGKKTP